MRRATRQAKESSTSRRFCPALLVMSVTLSPCANVMAFVGWRHNGSMAKDVSRCAARLPALRQPSDRWQPAIRHRQPVEVASSRRHGKSCRNHGFTKVVASSALVSCLIGPASAMAAPSSTVDLSASYHLSRILFLRLLAVVYIAAFSVARLQNRGLIGDRGITPARFVLDSAEKRGRIKSHRRKEWIEQRDQYASSRTEHPFYRIIKRGKPKFSDSPLVTFFRDQFWYRTDGMNRPLPTLLWFAKDRANLNPWLDNLANAGLFLSMLILTTGSANALIIFGLWIIQRSLMSVGGVWYGYGWEPQLAELTFHAMFLVPFFSLDPFLGWNRVDGPYPVPKLVIWAVRWYLFKIMLGAGLIKVKSSDKKWKPGNMSAMYYFYETQPVPNPFSRYFHLMPKTWHKIEVWSNHFVELIAPFMLLSPFRRWRVAGGLIQIIFQLILISSGNLSFLNWLTIVPAILCIDDKFFLTHLPPLFQDIAFGTATTQSFLHFISSKTAAARSSSLTRSIMSISFFLLMSKLNIPVVRNLLARRQVMNGSFDKLRLVSTYGAFGTVAETREELVIESASDVAGPWKEYQFKVKPGDVSRRPSWISPYHHRLDWQMWISAQVGCIEKSPWLYSFLLTLLNQEKDVIDLIQKDPWQPGPSDSNTVRPKFIRIEKYRYKFYRKRHDSSSGNRKLKYWTRERLGTYFPRQGVMTAAMLKEMIEKYR